MAARTLFQAALISCLIMIQIRDLTAQDVVHLNTKTFEELIKEPEVRIVYFSTINFSGLQNFIDAYESSAQLLAPFGVKMAILHCRATKVPEYCDKPEIHNSVFAFKNGAELLELLLVNMFDVNSIMSNVLQLVLLKEVPILQSKEERIQYEEQLKGKSDIIFSFQQSIGTYEHRILMEIAHAYKGEFAFALTTEEEVIDDMPDKFGDDDVALWVGRCKDATKEEPCKYTKYYDPLDTAHLSSYLRLLNIKLMHDVSSNKVNNPLADFDIHVAVVFYDKDSKEAASNVAQDVNARFQGSVGVITVDLDNVDGKKYGFVRDVVNTPGVALFMKNAQHPRFLETEFTSESAIEFIRTEMEVYASTVMKKNPARTTSSSRYGVASPTMAQEDRGSLWSGRQNNPDEGNLRSSIHMVDTSTDRQTEDNDEIASVEKQDDAVAEAVFQLRTTPIIRDHLPALTDKTFPEETGSRDVLMVTFYLDFDARSMAFMRSYSEAAVALAQDNVQPLAAVNCYDWTDVCGKENITMYPTIRIYKKGQFTVYTGPLDAKAVTTAMKLFLSPAPVQLQTDAEVIDFTTGNLPSEIGKHTPISILGVFSKKQKSELDAFKDASLTLHGKYLMGYAPEDLTDKLLKTYNMKEPGLVVFNRDDPYQPQQVIEANKNAEKLVQAMEDAVLPVMPELTAANFHTYFGKGQPLAILFAKGDGNDEENAVMKSLSEVALNKGNRRIVYCWMKVDEMDPLSVGSYVMKDYNSGAVAPALSIVSHAKASVYNYHNSEFTKDMVLKWVDAVLDGSTQPYKMLPDKEWKPLNPGYDFLSMIDQENSERQSARDRLRKDPYKHKVDEELVKVMMGETDDEDMAPVQEEGMAVHPHTEL